MNVDAMVLRTNQMLHMAAAAWLFALALIILVDVLGRSLFNAPLAGTAEIVANSVVSIAFLQLSHSIRMGGMLRAEILDPFLARAVVRGIGVIACLLGATLFAAVAYSAWEPMVEAWRIGEFAGNEGSLKVPTYPVRTILVAMSVLASCNYLIMAWQRITGAAAGAQH